MKFIVLLLNLNFTFKLNQIELFLVQVLNENMEIVARFHEDFPKAYVFSIKPLQLFGGGGELILINI